MEDASASGELAALLASITITHGSASQSPSPFRSVCHGCGVSYALTFTTTNSAGDMGGVARRCEKCQSYQEEIKHDTRMNGIVTHDKWDICCRQELLPVTLSCDRLSTGTGTGTGGGLGQYRFEEYEVATDALIGGHFVTGFDCFECTSMVSLVSGCGSLPADLIEMCDTILPEQKNTKPDIYTLESTATANKNTEYVNDTEIDADEFDSAYVDPGSTGEVSDPGSTQPTRVDSLTHAKLLRSVSAFIRGDKCVPDAPLVSSPSVPLGPVSLIDQDRTKTIAMPFSTVKEETSSDMELASDVSRGASSAIAQAALIERHPSDVTVVAAAAPSSTADMQHQPQTNQASTLNAFDLTPAHVEALESELNSFLGLDSLDGSSPAVPSSTSAAPPVVTVAPTAVAPMSSDVDPYGDVDATFASLAPLDDRDEDLSRGLEPIVSTYLSGAHMAVETESASGLNIRCFSIARGFSMQFVAALDEFGAQGFGLTAAAPAPSPPTLNQIQNQNQGHASSASLSRTSSSALSRGFGSLSRGLSSLLPDSSSTLLGGVSGIARGMSQLADSIATQNTNAPNTNTRQMQTAAPSGVMLQAAPSSFAPSPSLSNSGLPVSASSLPPLNPASTRPPHSTTAPMTGVTHAKDITHQHPFGQAQPAHTLLAQSSSFAHMNAFSSVAQRFPSILRSGILPAAAFQRVYNDEMRRQLDPTLSLLSNGVWPDPFSSSSDPLRSGSMSLSAAPLITSTPSIGYMVGTPLSAASSFYIGGSGSQTIGEFESQNEFGDVSQTRSASNLAGTAIPDTHATASAPPPTLNASQRLPSVPPFHRVATPSHPCATPGQVTRPAFLDAYTMAALSGIPPPPAGAGTESQLTQPGTAVASPPAPPKSTGFPASLSALSHIFELVSAALRDPLTDFFRLLSIDPLTSKLAAYICAETQKRGLCPSRLGPSISAAALYMALTLENKKPTQAEYCRKVNVTEVTLRQKRKTHHLYTA